MSSQIAAQLYTLRDFTKTPADITSTFKRVRQIGFEAVQCSALGPIDPKELAGILKGEGLTCCATHTGWDALKSNPQKVIDDHLLWNCKYTAIGGFFPKDPTPALWKQFAIDYNETAKKFIGTGVSLGYHNHSHELVKLDDKTIQQHLIDELDPSVWFEIDTYWITHGGGDPAQWIEKVAGRIPCVHFKDMKITIDRQQLMAEVGEGNLNWPRIIDSCRNAGVQWYIIEQDNCYGKDPFDCLELSINNLRSMGIQ